MCNISRVRHQKSGAILDLSEEVLARAFLIGRVVNLERVCYSMILPVSFTYFTDHKRILPRRYIGTQKGCMSDL